MEITYEGPAHLAPLAAAILEEEGIEVTYDGVTEKRSGAMSNPVVIYFAMKFVDQATEAATDAAIERARDKLAERFPTVKLFRSRDR